MREPIIDRATTLVALAGLALLVSGHATSQVARTHTSATTQTNVQAAKTPYTAEYQVTRLQTLADGSTITQEHRSKGVGLAGPSHDGNDNDNHVGRPDANHPCHGL